METRLGKIKSAFVEIDFNCGTYDKDIIAILIYFDISDIESVAFEDIITIIQKKASDFSRAAFDNTVKNLQDENYIRVDPENGMLSILHGQTFSS